MPRAVSISLIAWALSAAFMFLLWMWQRRRADAGIVDVGWAAGLGLVSLLFALALDGFAPRRALVGAVACLWSGRLASYLLFNRVLRSPSEDGRYAKLRQQWGTKAQAYFLIFFQVQAAWVVLFAMPILAAMINPHPALRWSDWCALAIAVLSISGESLADRQLARFRADSSNRGQTCREGLWGYSRHPNYFFEWLAWWSYVLFSLGGSLWWLSLLGPVLMLLFLFKITGIPYTEAQALRSRGDDYRRYQRTTSVFIPWFPRKERT